jgi:hypothetical protein
VKAQSNNEPFRAYLSNNEYDVFLRINFYEQDVNVPGQDLFGQVPGYLGKKNNSFAWLITSAKINGNKAKLQLINDYGSEDLTATLTRKNDSIYVLKQESGSTLKVPNKGKWLKLPKTLEFKRKIILGIYLLT